MDQLGKFLVVHPHNHPDNLWSIPKGLGEEGETSIESGIRETLEETNLDLNTVPKDGHYYEDLGILNYKHKNKRIHAHFMYINQPLSNMDLDLRCDSMYEGKDGKEYPECDIIKWVGFDFMEENLHVTQKRYIEDVKIFI